MGFSPDEKHARAHTRTTRRKGEEKNAEGLETRAYSRGAGRHTDSIGHSFDGIDLDTFAHYVAKISKVWPR